MDIFYYAVGATGRPEAPRSVMFHFDKSGRARRWSPPKGVASPSAPVPDVRFDFRRNWRLVRELLRDPEAEVQWIFVQRDLAARLIQQGVSEGEDPELLARASVIVRQPSDSEPHDDHMHIRVYCDQRDRSLACLDRGPERWWKKGWKYMSSPFGRGREAGAEAAVLQLLRGHRPVAFSVTPLSS